MKSLLIIQALLLAFPAFSQRLRGRIVDAKDHSIPSASIYIKENKQGLIANNDGEFQTQLSPGTYHIEFLCMSYETQNREVLLTDHDVELVVRLEEKEYQLQEVEIGQGEDRAYEIMRQAIKKAPYYQSVIKEAIYKAYIKGSGKMMHISRLINSMTDGNTEKYKDKLFMQESVSEITFKAPDQYEQNVIAYSNTFPNSDNPQHAMPVGMVSLYHPKYGRCISPLNPKAFDYYRFRYEGYEEENGRFINKIRIIPKLNDPQLMKGFIYIADDEWNIRHAEITVSSLGTTQQITLNYYPVIENIYLIATYEINMDFDLLGVKLNAAFLASIRYEDIQLNDSLIAQQANRLTIKKEKAKRTLEIKRDDYWKKTVDSLAVKRDSLYWAAMRTVVLNEEELKSYARKDTMQALTDSIIRREKNPKFKKSDLLRGGKLGNDSSALYVHYDGFWKAFPEYNFVDGLWMGQSLKLDFKKQKNSGIQINPAVYWTSARKKLIWETEALFDYAPKRLGQLSVSTGRKSEDFSDTEGMNRLQNSLYSLLGISNYARFYEKNYGNLFNKIDLFNGLQLEAGMEIAQRQELANHTTWNLWGQKNQAKANIPDYNQPLNGECDRLTQYVIHLKYTPEYYYRIDEGKKRYVRSRFPTFEVDYRQGIKSVGLQSRFSQFRRMELSVKQQIKLSIFTRLDYVLIAGKFFNRNPFNYIDYKHFSTNAPWLTFKDWKSSYALLPYYTYATNQSWLQGFINYDTDYLLLKRLPFLQGKWFTETLQAKFLHTPDKKYYSEWGYSLNMYPISGIGVFVAFDSFRYNAWGVQLSLPLLDFFRKKQKMEVSITL